MRMKDRIHLPFCKLRLTVKSHRNELLPEIFAVHRNESLESLFRRLEFDENPELALRKVVDPIYNSPEQLALLSNFLLNSLLQLFQLSHPCKHNHTLSLYVVCT